MSSFLTEVKGFTPVIDVLAKETSLVSAAIYGVVWRYCQMENGICHASIKTIAEHVGISRRTVERHLTTLCELGYLIDTTPDRRNSPHVYKDAGKAKIIGLVEATIEVRQNDEPVRQNDEPRCDKMTYEERETIKETTTRSAREEVEKTPAKGNGYSDCQREFLSLFGGKRFKNRTQAKTIAELEDRYGPSRVMELGVWAAKCGMSVGRAVISTESALQKKYGRAGNGNKTVRVDL